MLLKFTKVTGAGSGSSSSNTTTTSSSTSSSTTYVARGTGMRMTMSTSSTMTPRIHRKGFRTPSKRHPGKALPGKLHSISRIGPGKIPPGKIPPGKRFPQRPHPPPCDNSNDSGFGFDQHMEVQQSSSSSSSNNNNNISSSSSSSSNSSNNAQASTSSSSSNGNGNHSQLLHTPQQHLIRAIPSSSSTSAKKIPSIHYNHRVDDDEDEQVDEDFCTDDSEDCYTSRNLGASSSASPTSSTYSSGSGSGSGSGSALSSTTLFSQHHEQEQSVNRLKRKKLESHVELDNDDACSEDAFIRKIANASNTGNEVDYLLTSPSSFKPKQTVIASNIITHTSSMPAAPTKFISNGTRAVARVAHKRQPAASLNSVATSSDGRVQLEIVSQPEQQHRARYQTEGSRGAVKDRSGNGFPIVRLIGYNKPALLQVFIGTDIGRVAPHMFYQACKVAGKNSTQCNEKKLDGTMVIEIDFKPETEMTVTCDCVGILKERNVDVEHRFPDHLTQKNKKKSTRCRMVFRTQLAHEDGTMETLQVCSNPIICTQPPGVPEICKKSLNSCPVDGGLELFIIGKNFLKDTHVIFQESYESADLDDPNSEIAVRQQLVGALWEQTVMPDKEYLQQTHLICTVPPYIHQNILKPVTVQVSIISSGKKSEPHAFVYTPKGTYTTLAAATTLSNSLHGSLSASQDSTQYMDASVALTVRDGDAVSALWNTETKHELDSGMMPPPITTQMPMGVRRPSLPTSSPMITDQQLAHLNAVAAEALKTELLDESSQNSLAEAMHSPETAPRSPTTMYHTRYGRKTSMDAMMYESNSMPGFPVTPAAAAVANAQMEVVAAAVEMAVKNEIAKEIHAAVVQQQQQQQHHVTPHASVKKFYNNLMQNSVVAATNNAVSDQSVMFDNVNQAAVASAGALFPTEQRSNTSVLDHAFSDMLQQANVNNQPGTVLQRSISLNSSSSSHSNGSNSVSPLSGGSNSSPSNSLNGHSSPLTQDIILNSEPAASLNTALPLQQLLHPTTLVDDVNSVAVAVASPENALSAEIIMNPAVSPSTILCSANGAATAVVPNIMAPHQVTMANSILNDIAMQSQPTHQDATVAALALSNIINGQSTSPTSVNGNSVQQQSPVVQPEVTAATSTAVSNMILKAAADFISNQEQHQQNHHHHHHQHQQQQQQQLCATENMLMSLNNTAAAATADPLVNLLLNHGGDVSSSAAAAVTQVAAAAAVAAEFPLGGMPSTTPQESLIVALATEDVMQKTVVAAAAVAPNGAVVAQQTGPAATSSILPPVVVGGVVPPTVPLPPELTTMSDQDLISYINPSTFDQI